MTVSATRMTFLSDDVRQFGFLYPHGMTQISLPTASHASAHFVALRASSRNRVLLPQSCALPTNHLRFGTPTKAKPLSFRCQGA